MAAEKRHQILVLLDVDGTLTKPRLPISPEFNEFLSKLSQVVTIGLISGSDLKKVAEQMGGEDVVTRFDYVFPENGLVSYKKGKLTAQESISHFLGEEKTQSFINFCLRHMSNIELPVKRGNFIEYRNGLINVCPVGRSCSQAERNQFHELDKKHKIRQKFVEALRNEFSDSRMEFAIGGQISIDAYPEGWDKRFCLNHLEVNAFKEIHFFGDRTAEGGNDYHLYSDPRVIGHSVTAPEDTMMQLKEQFGI